MLVPTQRVEYMVQAQHYGAGATWTRGRKDHVVFRPRFNRPGPLTLLRPDPKKHVYYNPTDSEMSLL